VELVEKAKQLQRNLIPKAKLNVIGCNIRVWNIFDLFEIFIFSTLDSTYLKRIVPLWLQFHLIDNN